MYSPPGKTSSKPANSRTGVKVAALFLGTFLAVFIGLFFLDLLATFGERAIVNAATSSQPAATAIDPKLESDLAKVLETSDAQVTADIKNPFADPSNISNQFSAANAAQSVPATSSAARTSNPSSAAQVNSPGSQSRQQQQPQNISGRVLQPNQSSETPQMDTRTRLQIREDRLRLGENVGPESSVFSIDDLLPVGVVSGGDGKDEVMFYSEAACRVVSFPVGTQFYDGWFDSLRQEGVVFGFFDQTRTRRMRAWGRSVTQGCTQGLLEPTSPDQALTTKGGD